MSSMFEVLTFISRSNFKKRLKSRLTYVGPMFSQFMTVSLYRICDCRALATGGISFMPHPPSQSATAVLINRLELQDREVTCPWPSSRWRSQDFRSSSLTPELLILAAHGSRVLTAPSLMKVWHRSAILFLDRDILLRKSSPLSIIIFLHLE